MVDKEKGGQGEGEIQGDKETSWRLRGLTGLTGLMRLMRLRGLRGLMRLIRRDEETRRQGDKARGEGATGGIDKIAWRQGDGETRRK